MDLKNRRYEKTQKGNPHRLTTHQHIFPKRSIERFCNADGCVEVMQKGGSRLLLKPNNPYFCAMRVWDQRAESGYMAEIESQFQRLADQIVANEVTTLSQEMQKVVSDFYLLWHLRQHYAQSPIHDMQVNGISIPESLSKDEQELLEARHSLFMLSNGAMPGRQLTGIHIQRNMDMWQAQMADVQWGILRTDGEQWLVPDCATEVMVVPITPTICLMRGVRNKKLSVEQVAVMNAKLIRGCERFYFVSDMSLCPVLRQTTLALRELVSIA